jgi:hypothetical protein
MTAGMLFSAASTAPQVSLPPRTERTARFRGSPARSSPSQLHQDNSGVVSKP